MTGLQEILIIAIIVVGILFLPRLKAGRRPVPARRETKEISGKLRLAIAASVLYPAVAAGVLQPWRRELTVFLFVGFGPVALGWLLYWVWMGFKNKGASSN